MMKIMIPLHLLRSALSFASYLVHPPHRAIALILGNSGKGSMAGLLSLRGCLRLNMSPLLTMKLSGVD